jgi:hypothetical protein
MKYLPPVAAVLVVLCASPVRADWAYTKWGMTPAQVAAASGGEAKIMAKPEKIEGAHMETAVKGTHTDGALKLNTAFHFDMPGGGLHCVLYAPQSPTQDEFLKQALAKQYGKAEIGGMPTIGYQTMVWNTPTDEIFMTIQDKAIAGVSHCKKE